MRLVACAQCRAQFDVSATVEERFRCHCGAWVENRPPRAVDAEVLRCAACGALLEAGADACGYCDSVVEYDRNGLGLICPHCYAQNREVARFCVSCGAEFRPLEVMLEGESVECPCCERTLAVRSVGGERVQECPKCRGIWAPGEVMDRLVERAVEARRLQTAGGGGVKLRGRGEGGFQKQVVYRRCPVCGGSMQRKNFARRSGIIVDWCGKHGTWLDADELEAVAAFVLEGGLGPEAPPQAASWRLPADEGRLKAMAEAEKLMAAERSRQDRGRPPDLLRTIGDLFGTLIR